MKKVIFVFAFLLVLTAGSPAQSAQEKVDRIRDACTAVNRAIERGAKDAISGLHYAAWTFGGKNDGRPWPAVGTMEIRDEIWFEGGDGTGEAGVPPVARKIVANYRGAADLHSRIEYCFDADGEPLFIFSNSDLDSADGKMLEQRYYYEKSRLIRYIRSNRTTDANFGTKEAEAAREAFGTAKKLQKRYAGMIGETDF